MSFRKRSLALAIINATAGMTLLLLSSWFIAASAMAGSAGVLAGFNYVVPAALIRFLAIIRIASGYFEKYAGHLHLLEQLHIIRKKILSAVFSKNFSISQSETGKTLEQTTEQLASAWAATYNPVFSSLTIAGAFSLLFIFLWPALLITWIGYLSLVCILGAFYSVQFNRAVKVENSHLTDFLRHQQRWLNRHTLWPLTLQQDTINELITHAENTSTLRHKQTTLTANFEHVLFLVSLLTLLILPTTHEPSPSSALFVVPFFILLSVKDWLFPMLHALNQNSFRRQQVKPLSSLLSSPLASGSSHARPLVPAIQTLELENFRWVRGSNRKGMPLTTTLRTPGLYLLSSATGVGKSSTFDALSGELGYEGRLKINGVDIDKSNIENRRRLIHHAQQFGHIFSDTLRQNLLIANPIATEEQMIEALIWAELPQWATQLKLAIWLGPEGIPISGGEQKRLLLARAYLSDSPIWLLDEPFEGIDDKTINRLVENLNKEALQRLVIVASHVFPKSLMKADTLFM